MLLQPRAIRLQVLRRFLVEQHLYIYLLLPELAFALCTIGQHCDRL